MPDGSIILKVGLDTADLRSSLKNVGSAVTSALSGVAKVTAAVTAAWGLLETYSISVGMEFETAMAQTATIMDKSVMSVGEMSDSIKQLSSEMGVSSASISNAVYNAISATGDTANAVSLVADATKLATAGFTDTDSALGVLTTSINAYGMAATDAEKISDSLIMTQNLGVTTVAQLSASMGKAIASASAYGVDLYNLEAAYISLTKGGINTAESTTYISSMMKELGKEGTGAAKLLKEKTGKSFSELMAEGSSLGDVLGVLYTACGNDATALMNLWSSAEAGKAANAIINQGLDQFNGNLSQLQGSAGTTEAAYETMCDTLQHQTEMLKTNIQNLGISVYEGLQDSLKDVASFGNELIGELQSAFADGGIEGLADTLAAQIPAVLDYLMAGISKALGAVMKWLPNAIKQLMGILPSVLSNLTGLLPQLLSALMDGAGVLLREFVAQLPALVPILAEGIGQLLLAAVNGVGAVVGGLMNGIGDILKGAGLMDYTLSETIDQIFDGADTSKYKDLEFNFDAEYNIETNPEEIKASITEAYNSIKTALDGTELSASQKQAVMKAVMDGTGVSIIKQALVDAGVDPKIADGVVETYTTAMQTISDALNELDIDEGAKAHVQDMAASGATAQEIEAYLISCGVEPTQANIAAGKILAARETIKTAIDNLDISDDAKTTLDALISSGATKQQVITYLESLGLNPEDYNDIIASYDTVAGSMTGKITGLYDSITKTLTDGLPDTPGQVSELQANATQYFTELLNGIEAGKQAALDALKSQYENGDLTGSEYDQQVQATIDKYSGMTQSVEDLATRTSEWINSMAGKSTEYVQAHLGELQDLAGVAEQIAAQIDGFRLTAEQADGAGNRRKLVEAGMVSDDTYQLEAIGYSADEYDRTVREATEKRDQALADAIDQLGKDRNQAAYDAAVAAAEAEFAQSTEAAAQNYANHMDAILRGIVANNAELGPKFKEAYDKLHLKENMETLSKQLQDGLSEGLSGDEMLSKLSDLNIDLQPIADQIGCSLEDLEGYIRNAMTGNNTNEWLVGWINESIGTLPKDVSEIISGLDLGDIPGLLQEAIDRGFLKESDFAGIDYSDHTALLRRMIDLGVIDPLDIATKQAEPEIEEAAGQVGDTVEESLSDVDGGSTEIEPEIEVNPKVEANADGLEEQAGEIQQEAADTIESASQSDPVETTTTVQNTVETEVTNADEVGNEVAEQATENISEVVTEPVAVSVTLAANVDSTSANASALAAGQQVGQAFASGVSEADASSAASILVSNAITALNGQRSAAMSAGRFIGQGFANGMSSTMSLVVSRAAALARAAVAAIKREAQINSPSKITYSLGGFFGEGFSRGIDHSVAKAVRSAETLTKRTIGAVNTSGMNFDAVTASVTDAAEAMHDASQRQIVLNVNGRKLGEVMASDTQRASNKYNRSTALGVGK